MDYIQNFLPEPMMMVAIFIVWFVHQSFAELQLHRAAMVRSSCGKSLASFARITRCSGKSYDLVHAIMLGKSEPVLPPCLYISCRS